MARNSKELAQRSDVDPEDEPSAEWGWHGTFPRTSVFAGIASIAVLLVFMIGEYQSRTQDLWILGTVALIVIGVIAQIVHRRNSWRR